MSTAVVVIGGEPGDLGPYAPVIEPETFVVAADSGYELAMANGIDVDLLIGDLDSISAVGLRHARSHGVTIESFDRDKDLTDLGLALAAIVPRAPRQLIALGNAGGRIDHQLAGTAALAAFANQNTDCAVEMHSHAGSIWFLLGSVDLPLSEGETLSVLPWGDDVVVSVDGVRWPLASAHLRHGSGRGVSNIVVGSDGCSVTVDEGLALVVVPTRSSISPPEITTPKELS